MVSLALLCAPLDVEEGVSSFRRILLRGSPERVLILYRWRLRRASRYLSAILKMLCVSLIGIPSVVKTRCIAEMRRYIVCRVNISFKGLKLRPIAGLSSGRISVACMTIVE